MPTFLEAYLERQRLNEAEKARREEIAQRVLDRRQREEDRAQQGQQFFSQLGQQKEHFQAQMAAAERARQDQAQQFILSLQKEGSIRPIEGATSTNIFERFQPVPVKEQLETQLKTKGEIEAKLEMDKRQRMLDFNKGILASEQFQTLFNTYPQLKARVEIGAAFPGVSIPEEDIMQIAMRHAEGIRTGKTPSERFHNQYMFDKAKELITLQRSVSVSPTAAFNLTAEQHAGRLAQPIEEAIRQLIPHRAALPGERAAIIRKFVTEYKGVPEELKAKVIELLGRSERALKTPGAMESMIDPEIADSFAKIKTQMEQEEKAKKATPQPPK